MVTNFNPHDTVIDVEVLLGGATRTVRSVMALDLGASISLIPWHFAVRLGYNPAVMQRRVKVTTPSGWEEVPLIRLKSIRALAKLATDITVGVHNLPDEADIDGLLGLNFFQRFEKLCLDFKKGEIELD